MNESVFKSTAETLSRSIANEIAYTYSIWGSDNESRVITKMKSNILLSDRKFLDNNTQSIAKNKLIFPYDFLIANVKSHIDNFYNQFNLNCETLLKLSHYGERANVSKRQFKENLEKSKETTLNVIIRELDLQILQGKDVKSVIRHIQSIVSKRTNAVKSLLEESAGQIKQYMLLWNYQDDGYTHYRFKTNGDNCKACTELDGKVFSIADAQVGVNLAPIHPNCDCTSEVLDENEAEIFTVKRKIDDNEESSVLDYLQTSLNQILLGNYADDTNALGTLGQIAIGLLGLDLPADIRDLVYDITHFKLTPQHALQTILDIAALVPVIGGVKYVDEAGDLVKSAVKHGDEVTNAVKAFKTTVDFSDFPKTIHIGKQGKHILGHNNYINGKSIMDISINDAQKLVNKYSGTGQKIGANRERVNFEVVIGKYVDPKTGKKYDTTVGTIHYSNDGTHIVPERPVDWRN